MREGIHKETKIEDTPLGPIETTYTFLHVHETPESETCIEYANRPNKNRFRDHGIMGVGESGRHFVLLPRPRFIPYLNITLRTKGE